MHSVLSPGRDEIRRHSAGTVLHVNQVRSTISHDGVNLLWLALSAVLFVAFPASGQSPVPVSDPEAVALAAKSIAAMTGGHPVQDATLTGTATRTAGGSDTGTVTLRALGNEESRVDLALTGGTRTEVRDSSTGVPLGKWIAEDGSSGTFTGHNTFTDAVWFFPPLGSLAAPSDVVLSYVGAETRDGESVQHLRSYVYQPPLPGQPSPNAEQLSTMDFYLDATTLLPVAEVFNQHPDNNALVNIPVEVDFSDYRAFSGVLVPLHIDKSVNGSPRLQVTITGATFNSGLTDSMFTAQ